MVQPKPLVSVCVPVFNGEALVTRAVASALEQDYDCVEVVVVDDASTDQTAEVLRDAFGDRIRLFRNRARGGQGPTTNTSIAIARGDLVKFLHHDDVLDPDCVSTMVQALTEHPTAGLAFSRRRVELASDDEESRAWLQRYRNVHRGFKELHELNRAPSLFEQLLANDLHDNWIGEPVCVMVRRACLDRVGSFSLKVRGAVDLGVWLRVAAYYDVAFVDRELATYRHSPGSHMRRQRRQNEHWLDRLWMLEALTSLPDLSDRFPYLLEFRTRERRMVRRTAARSLLGFRTPDVPLERWFDYLRYRLHTPGHRPPIVGAAARSAPERRRVDAIRALGA